jgi:hypothetical protein
MTGIERSQNGWPVLRSGAGLATFDEAGRNWQGANPAVARVARWIIRGFNRYVEPILEPGEKRDDWSWVAVRFVRGSTTSITNHASATAWDLNATRHPRGVKGTFSAAQLTVIRRMLAHLVDNKGRQVVRCGEFYEHAPTDGMHWEIIGTRAQVEELALRLEHDGDFTMEADMQWSDPVPLTANDAVIWGKNAAGKPYKAGDEVTVGDMIRYPTLARKTDARVARLEKQLAELLAKLGDDAGRAP